jgi:hypothetical protein
MRTQGFVIGLTFGLLIGGSALTAGQDGLKSGPQVGAIPPGPFHSLVAHSEEPGLAGKKTDFFEMYGGDPVVLIFARQMTKPLTRLVKQLDVEVARRTPAKLRAVVVILADDNALEKNLKDFGEKQAIKHVNLAIMAPDGPKNYKLSREAEITVVMYRNRKVEANHAFKRGELNGDAIDRILADVPKVATR